MAETGRILRIEKLSSFDGQGLRTVVFLKGCPLTCRWCSTPESQRSGTDFGVDRNLCTGCFSCTEACPEGALTWDMRSERFITDFQKCTSCLSCVGACPAGARRAWGYTADTDEIFKEVEKDSLFYFHSGGGVTLSGGEPLMQAEFTAQLLKKCRDHGIHTAVETCGMVPWEAFETVLPHLDDLFFDLKHMDASAHRSLTGASNIVILKNLGRIDASAEHLSVVVRMPVIPGLNDQEENIRALGEFCRKLKRLDHIELLPYHRLGLETYRRMGRAYELESSDSGSADALAPHAETLEKMQLRVSIGG